MKYIPLTAFVLAAACAPQLASGQEQQAVTLAEAVRIAVERHPDVGKARANADILKGKTREVRAQALPEVNITSNPTRLRDPSLLNASGIDQFPEELRTALIPHGVNMFDYNLTLRQPIYTAGKVGTALRLASIEAEGALADIDRSEQDLALSVVKAYYDLMWAERNLGVVEETQEQKKLHADMARTRFKNGVATEVDVLRSEVAVANGQPDVVRARNAIRLARAQLNYYLVRPIEFPTQVVGEFEEKPWDESDLEALSREAMRRRPELNRLRLAEKSAAAQLDLARAESRMRIDFNTAYGIMTRLPQNLLNNEFTRWSFGVNFTLPVFDGLKRSGMVWQATASQRVAKLEREKMEQQVQLGLQQGLDDLAAARETVEASRATVRQAEKVLEMTQANYQYGAATTLDVVDAQTAVSVARTNLLRGLHDYAVARANLRWTIGRTPWE